MFRVCEKLPPKMTLHPGYPTNIPGTMTMPLVCAHWFFSSWNASPHLPHLVHSYSSLQLSPAPHPQERPSGFQGSVAIRGSQLSSSVISCAVYTSPRHPAEQNMHLASSYVPLVPHRHTRPRQWLCLSFCLCKIRVTLGCFIDSFFRCGSHWVLHLSSELFLPGASQERKH